jgi:hypothetical protein
VSTLPDATIDPASYVLAVADRGVLGDDAWLAQFALWRGIAERHRPVGGEKRKACDCCYRTFYPCPDLLAVVEAAEAYAGMP